MTSEKRAQKFHTDDGSVMSHGKLLQPIRSTTQIWVVTRHQYGISAVVCLTSFRGETSRDGVAKCWLFFLFDSDAAEVQVDDCLTLLCLKFLSFVCVLTWSLLGIKKSLGHAQIGLL